MSGFGMLIEDPFYDEDGVLIDEDADWEDAEDIVDELNETLKPYDDEYGPYSTINS
jgi:hypothetical protein